MTDSNWDFENDRTPQPVPAVARPEQPMFAPPGTIPAGAASGTSAPAASGPGFPATPARPPLGRTVFPPTTPVARVQPDPSNPYRQPAASSTGALPAALPSPPGLIGQQSGLSPFSSPSTTPPSFSPPSYGSTASPQGPPSVTQAAALRYEEASAVKTKKQRGWGWRALVAFIAGALISGAAFTAGTMVNEQSADVAAPTITPVSNQTDNNNPAPSLEPTEGENPAAFVAADLGPSVVQIRTDVGAGSGVVYKDGGFIMTNNHVIEGFTDVFVIDSQGRTLNGTVVGSDARADIAVVQVTGLDLPVADLALGQDLSVGQTAIAIGSPFDLSRSVTSGIISALNRPLPNQNGTFMAMIQTDAPINPGNSGGPLANRVGEVIGINTAIRTDGVSNSNVGVGFAVPIDTAFRVAERITSGQSLEPGFLGVGAGQSAIGQVGVVVTNIDPDSAADLAGLQDGDRVLMVNEAPVTAFDELAGLISNNFPGDEITLEIVRGTSAQTVVAVLGERN